MTNQNTTTPQQAADSRHRCHAADCEIPVPTHLLMCRKHWKQVPPEIKKLIIGHREHKDVERNTSPQYQFAVSVAIIAVKKAERKQLSPQERSILLAVMGGGDRRLDAQLYSEHVEAVVAAGEDIEKDDIFKRAKKKKAQRARTK